MWYGGETRAGRRPPGAWSCPQSVPHQSAHPSLQLRSADVAAALEGGQPVGGTMNRLHAVLATFQPDVPQGSYLEVVLGRPPETWVHEPTSGDRTGRTMVALCCGPDVRGVREVLAASLEVGPLTRLSSETGHDLVVLRAPRVERDNPPRE